jgi:superfamily I DNA/RNA helicase
LVTVRHFDRLAANLGCSRRAGEPDAEFGKRVLAMLQERKLETTYDAVLIDEAQDFDPSWLQCARQLLTDPANGDLVIVGDGNQGVYGKRRTSWSSLGISARGRTMYLRKSYRSSREIIEFAAPFARTEGHEDDGVCPLAIEPAQARRSTGIRPVVLRAKNRVDECQRAAGLIWELLQGSFHGIRLDRMIHPSEVGVLVPFVPDACEPALTSLQATLEQNGVPVIRLWDGRKRGKADTRSRIGEPGVKVLNVYHAKGLQFRAVVFLWADQLPLCRTRHEQEALFYVALTRAEDYLVVLHSGVSELIDRLPCPHT